MTILVTGGAGFIGSHLCDRLIANGQEVVAIDNLSLGRRENLAQLDGHGAFTFVQADAADGAALESVFDRKRIDAVFHMAANSDIARSHDAPMTDFTNTLSTTWAVLETMRRHHTGYLVFASTSAIYGEVSGVLSEDHGPLMPISHYGAAKLASEAFISSFAANYGIRAWIARFPNVVGDRATHGAIFDLVAKLRRSPARLEVLGDGTQVKPYLHVADLIEAILTAWSTFRETVNIFNIGGTTRCTVRRMAEIIIEEAGTDTQIDYAGGDRGWIGDVPSVAYDTSRIRSTGWQPRLDSEGAVRATARALLQARGA